MKFSNLISGILVKRYKRFLADIMLESGEIVTAHCPNSGSMLNCSTPGSEVLISIANNPKRKLKYTWEMIRTNHSWTGINTSLANKIVREGIENKTIRELQGYKTIRGEVPYGNSSRVDFLLETDEDKCYVEVKNVSLQKERIACFPDSVTTRGQKHLKELMAMVNEGHKACLFFLVQMSQIEYLKPADEIDPEYGCLLRAAYTHGVDVLAYQANLSPEEIIISQRIPVNLD